MFSVTLCNTSKFYEVSKQTWDEYRWLIINMPLYQSFPNQPRNKLIKCQYPALCVSVTKIQSVKSNATTFEIKQNYWPRYVHRNSRRSSMWRVLRHINTLRARQSCRRLANDVWNKFSWIKIWCILIHISKGSSPADSKPASVQIMAWCRTGDKQFMNQWWFGLLTRICVTRSRWVIK